MENQLNLKPSLQDKYVWYACYGSNLCLERFLHYIDGEERSIFGHKFEKWDGCSNKEYPIEDRPYEFKYNIYFANNSRSWENKGVAFIDLSKKGHAYGRIFKITEEQFSQIRCKEGRGLNWYGYPQNDFTDHIDVIDGIKVFTFTQKDFNTKRVSPSETYKSIIIKGLIEIGLTKEQSDEYIEKCMKY